MSALVLFDGVCNFCNGAVNFVIERDNSGYFKFAPLQSAIGEQIRDKHGIDRLATDSIVLIENDQPFLHSTAALRIARRLNGLWPAFYAFIIVPRPLRDLAYRLFAKYRYKLFGRQDSCMVPTEELRSRFM
jgi:predicted DCC family thiol-disulfide oxidoreductase YuxK